SGRAGGNVIEVRSVAPITEPFLTFLVEAAWARGRLLREYTLLLDPPTFAPPAAAQTTPAVTAPVRTAPADSGRIERPPPAAEPAPRSEPIQRPRAAAPQPPAAEPPPQPAAEPAPAADDRPFATTGGDTVYVDRGETLWGIAQRVRPDSRLSMNQTMLAIFEANPEAFGGNINVLRAGSTLRIPSADRIFNISRGDALDEVRRQHSAWGSGATPVADTTTRPDLTLVPPDDDYVDDGFDATGSVPDAPATREDEIEARIAEIEAADVPAQASLIEIRNNELAALRRELAELRGEVYVPPVEETPADAAVDAEPPADGVFVDDGPAEDEILAEDEPAPDAETAPVADEPAEAAEAPPAPAPARPAQRRQEPSLVDRALGLLTNFWTILGAALLAVGGVLFWFMRRGGADEDLPVWQAPDVGDEDADLGETETLRAPSTDDDSFVVVEQDTGEHRRLGETGTGEAPAFAPGATGTQEGSGQFGSLEDTFSSETAVNLDQSDPIAEADFHMAYGLYDQAADLINGALEVEPERQDLLTKLCEVYFVWGNRDAFVDAAGRLKDVVGDGDSADWDKIVIMGQQIASDHELFAGAGVAGATKAVDLSFEAGMDETGSLDMELFADGSGEREVLDIGAADDAETVAAEADGGVDFDLDDATAETRAVPAAETDAGDTSAVDFDLSGDDSAVDFDFGDGDEDSAADETDLDLTAEMPADDATAEIPAVERTQESPTIEEQLADLGATSELPTIEQAQEGAAPSGDATAEINLDDLGLDVSGLAETELASLDDLDATAESDSLDDDVLGGTDTGINEAVGDMADATGKNPEVDPSATGVQTILSAEETGRREALDPDATGTDFDTSLLDATGVTQVLPPEEGVETGTDLGKDLAEDEATMLAPGYGDDGDETLGDDQQTLLAGLDDDGDEDDYDFAKTEALPADVFTGNASMDETGELPAIASTDVDLDLDDLTAALQVSDAGDTVEQLRDDATVQQPRPGMDEDETAATMSLGPEDMDEDLHEARTMTEVGTKLDLARAYVDMGDPAGARSILEEVLDEGDAGQRQQAQQLLDSLPT
ncbi:MAG: FimV/HubP family polar landmark protein, partial [Woeseiaceae bacterium]|nr:FimV/HubP family polar landmark protein [Woeseiaceae bacterium]